MLKYRLKLKDIKLEDFKVYLLALFKAILPKKKIKKNKVIDKKLENCFRVLELNSDSTLKEIKSRYKMLAKKWHPDAQNSVASRNNKDKLEI